ncbi:MAG: GGDEF domain-containing protein [Bacillus sp. (in: Bacteria)]|nr:GGDEF domain-containing protein [Bacillus sp. (in: firmicutes)]
MKLLSFVKQAYHNDHVLEILFASLRWFFVVISIVVFTIQFRANPNETHLYLFMGLVAFGIIYMAISEYFLHKTPKDSRSYTIMTKGAPAFDFLAFIFLISLTGGISSPLFPIAYLIILHVAVYWKFNGGMIAALLFMTSYTVMYYFQAPLGPELQMLFIANLVFLFLVGFIGGLIVARERKHYSERNEMEDLAKKDYLTSLYNHRSFQEHLRQAHEENKTFYLVLADIDGFKQINDSYGHVKGDEVLRKLGTTLKNSVPGTLGDVYRYGGEEFAIILYTEDPAIVQALVQKIKLKVQKETFIAKKKTFSLTMSFGFCKNQQETPNRLVEKADRLLYEAKQSGKNCIVCS